VPGDSAAARSRRQIPRHEAFTGFRYGKETLIVARPADQRQGCW
jgi:hypothetical protein